MFTERELEILLDALMYFYDLNFESHTPEEYDQLCLKLSLLLKGLGMARVEIVPYNANLKAIG